jgi:hypothetical protein
MTSTVCGSPKTVTVEYSSLCICSGRVILLIIKAVKTISLFYGQGAGRNGAQESAMSRGSALCGQQLATETTARLKIHRGQKSAALSRLRMDLMVRDQTGWWEQMVFIALWLCGLFSVGYCLKTVLSVPWPG